MEAGRPDLERPLAVRVRILPDEEIDYSRISRLKSDQKLPKQKPTGLPIGVVNPAVNCTCPD